MGSNFKTSRHTGEGRYPARQSRIYKGASRNWIPAFAGMTAIIISLLLCTPSPASARQMEDMGIVVLRTIDKVSARTRTFEIPVDKTVKFGASLFIKARACRKSSPMEQPESAAFLQIWERKPHEEKPNWVFSGWMFASNPSIAGMDHPVYDVWVIDCKNSVTSVKPQEFSSEATPEGAPVKGVAAPSVPAPAPEAAPEPTPDATPDPNGD